VRRNVIIPTPDSDEISEKLYTIQQVAEWLQLSPKTIRRYLAAGMFEFLYVVKRPERNRTLFTQASIVAFRAKYQTFSERQGKRAYNRRAVKGRRKKK
jgi:hypothetical protein